MGTLLNLKYCSGCSHGHSGLSATEAHPYIHPSHDAGSLEGICVASNKDVRLKRVARKQGTDKLAIYTWTVTFELIKQNLAEIDQEIERQFSHIKISNF